MSNIVALAEEFQQEPNSRVAEQAVLGSIMVNNAAFTEVATIIREEHFYDPIHGQIFARMVQLIPNDKPADHVSLSNGDAKITEYLADMARAASSIIDAPTYAEIVRDDCHRRMIRTICREIGARCLTPEYEMLDMPANLIGELKHGLSEIEADYSCGSMQSLGSVMQRLEEHISRRVKPFTTGLPSIDRSLDGGLRVGDLYVIEAPAKTFKTGTLGTIALEMIRNDVPSLFVTLEMAPEQVMARLVSAETGCNATNLMAAERHDDALGRCKIFTDKFGQRRGYFSDRPGIKAEGLASLCSSAVAKFGVEVIFIDYWQLIGGKGKAESMADHLEQVAYWAAAFARKNDVAIVMASQLNRQGESLRSAGIERACSWLARLHKCEISDRFTGEIQGLWMEVPYTRFSQDCDIGSNDNPAFRIDGIGPVLKEIGDWRRGG